MWTFIALGALTAAAVVEIVARLSLMMRDRQFASLTPSAAARVGRLASSDEHDARFEESSAIWQEMHDCAKAAQRKYLLLNTRSVAVLAIALIVLFATLVLFKQPPSWLKALAVLVDLAAFALVLHWRRVAIREQATWIVSRCGAELLRHSHYLRKVVPTDDVSSLVNVVRAASSNALYRRDINVSALSAELERLQRDRIRRNRIAITTGFSVSRQDWLRYIEAWPAKQERWFAASYERLRKERHLRENLLKGTFWTGAVVAAIKLLLLLLPASIEVSCVGCITPSSLASFAMVSVTTFSASMLAYHANRNSRSLFHLYALQLQRLRDWRLRVDGAGIGTAIADSVLREADDQSCANCAIDLDGIMFDELLAWMHVTGYDVLELAA